jgi:hypothetical protein
MSQLSGLETLITRRNWVVLAVSALAGCGGGGGVTAGMPGTGGTGIYAVGAIQGFGSVIVNSIKFDDMNATVSMDGVPASSADLRLGMVAGVDGARGADATLGTANTIEVWTIAQGVVSQVGSGQFDISGMTVKTDSATVLDGISSLSSLFPGMRVAVWGLQAASDGRTWTATRLSIVTATSVVSSGVVTVTGSQRYLNGLLLTGSAAAALTAGQLVRVQGILSLAGNSLQVSSVTALYASNLQAREGDGEIEGLVTAILSATRFTLGTIEVDASSASFSPSTITLTTGMRVEVEGAWQAGVLKAVNVEYNDEQVLLEVEIDAPIEQFTSIADFVVRGQRCNASAVTRIGNGTVSDLKVGTRVHLKGSKAGDVLIVTELEIDP